MGSKTKPSKRHIITNRNERHQVNAALRVEDVEKAEEKQSFFSRLRKKKKGT